MILMELADQGMIGLGGGELIDHIHGRGETAFDVGITGGKDQGLGQEGFTGAGIADEQDIPALGDEVEGEEIEDLGFLVQSGLMMMEVELVQGGFIDQAGTDDNVR